MKTFRPKVDEIERKWYVVDAEGKTLGRLASRLAVILRGKHKPIFTPGMDTGDFIVVVNAGKVAVTGNKLIDKTYYSHSGYPGAISSITLEKLMEKKPEEAIKKAVWGMLPKGTLGRAMFKKLKVYAEADHPHTAQKPESLNF
ncbi:MAG: 50S ribosomal protein L13 [Thermodesulfobacteriota bacterium]